MVQGCESCAGGQGHVMCEFTSLFAPTLAAWNMAGAGDTTKDRGTEPDSDKTSDQNFLRGYTSNYNAKPKVLEAPYKTYVGHDTIVTSVRLHPFSRTGSPILTHCYLVMLEAANAVRQVSVLPCFTPDSSDTGCFQGKSGPTGPIQNIPPLVESLGASKSRSQNQ